MEVEGLDMSTYRKKIDFWRTYVEVDNPNADLAPRATGRLFQGGPTTGIPEPTEPAWKQKPRLGHPTVGPHSHRIKKGGQLGHP